MPNVYFKRVDKYDVAKKISSLNPNETLGTFLKEKKLLDIEMWHFLRMHIKATLFWRKIPIWSGNYWDIHGHDAGNLMRITESTSTAGNYVTIEGNGMVLARVRESVSVQVVGNDVMKVIMSTIITVGTVAATAMIPAVGATKAALAGAIARKQAAINLATGMMTQASNILMSSPSFHEISETMNIHEFKHKYLFSKTRPISLRIEYNQELANQYLNKRELKGPMLYSYTNLEHLGTLLAQKDFFKASVISLNMPRNSEWFREKIENGVYLYDHDYQGFYKKKLSDDVIATSQGGITRGHWDEFTFINETETKVLITADVSNADYSNVDYIGSSDPNIWQEINRANNNCHVGNSPFPNNCLGCLLGGGSKHSNWKGNQDFVYNFTSGGIVTLKTRGSGPQSCTIPSQGGQVTLEIRGSSARLIARIKKETAIKNTTGNPAGIPPSTQLPTDPNIANTPPAIPFNPNQFPQSGNLIPNPTGSGEQEFSVPDIDIGPDPDWDQGLDIDLTQDIDPTQDPDKPTDPDLPPDIPPDDPDDPD